MAAFASSCCFFLALSISLAVNCQPSQCKPHCRVCAPVTVRISEFVHPFLQIRNTIQWLRAAPWRLSSCTTQFRPFYFECEHLSCRGSRGSIFDSDEQRSEIANVNQGPNVPRDFIPALCLSVFDPTPSAKPSQETAYVGPYFRHWSTTSLGIRPGTSYCMSERTTQQ